MITLTQNAKNRIAALIAKDEKAIGVRLSIKTGGCSGNEYHMDLAYEAQDGDDAIAAGEGAALYIPKTDSWKIMGMTIDYREDDTLGNAGFEFINPNESGRCGCGVSFTLQELSDKV